MKKIFAILTFIAFTTTVMAQTKGITYQAVLYDPAYKNQTLPGVDNTLIPYANKSVCLRFQITDKNNQAIYIETQSTKTDPFGMVNLIIGQGNKIGGLVSSFDAINWNTQANSLIVSLDNSGNCSDFNEVTNQPFTASPFALGNTSINTADYELIANKSNNIINDANSTIKYPSVNAIKSYVDSKVITIQDADATTKGKIQLTGDLGGTASLPTVPGLALKVDKEVGKGLSTNDFTTIEKTKLAAITGSNTGDQDLSSYATISSLANKVDKEAGKGLSSNDYTTAEKTKLAAITGTNTGDQDLSSYATISALDAKVDKVAGKDLSSNDYTTAEKTKLAAITGTNTGDQDLSSYATISALDAKVDKVAGKDLSSNDYTTAEKTKLGAITGTNTGDQDLTGYATISALDAKVDKVSGKDLSSNDYTTAEKTKLGAITGTNTGDQDLTGYATVTALDAKVANVITDAITTSAPSQNAVYDALALKASVVDVTGTEITLPAKIGGKQLFSKSGTLTILSGTAATIPAITDLTDYYSIQIFKDGKPFRNEVRLFTVANPIAIVTGNGMMSEIYPSGGTYTYVLQYFK